MLKVDDIAPAFRLACTSGKDVSLADLRGKKVVLYFYPKDDTPGCTRESCDFRDNLARLKGQGAIVLGVSRDTIASHTRFRTKYELPFELLSDPEAKAGKAYGAFGQKMMYGRPIVGTIRSTFLIDEKGRIAAVWSPVKVDGHVDQVLAALAGKSVSKASSPRSTRSPRLPQSPHSIGSLAKPAKRAAVTKPASKKSSAPEAALPAAQRTRSARASSARKTGSRR
jgi:thioredoxin-dependent peroxiredoxin